MHRLEWPCRILLIMNAILAILGYINFLQTDHQLVSPLIPPSVIMQLAKHSVYAGLPAAVLLIVALCFYFAQKRTVVIILSSLAITSYFILNNTDWA